MRLIWLQVVQAPELAAAAKSNSTNTITLSSKRGTIYDRNGNVLATSVDCETIYCNPHEVTDVSVTAQLLAADLGGDASDYEKLLSKDTTFVYLKKKVDTSVATQLTSDLSDAGINGVYELADTKRIYPYGKCAGQVLGLVGSDGHGLTGLELEYDDVLSGTDGEMVLETGADGTPIAGGNSEVTAAKNGTDIVISIDVNIQQTAEDEIEKAVKTYSASSGTVMATDPSTGEVLACCSTPLLDPSDTSSVTDEQLQLKPVSDSYEPGSMFKCLTMAIGIENGLISADTTFSVPSSVQVGTDNVTDDDGRDYTMSMSCREIMRRSSNTGAVIVGTSIGADVFSQGISAFGIGQATGIDYPGEVSGIVTQRSDYTGATLGSMSFGQGLAIPMDQIVRAIGALANKGVLTTPHFLLAKGEERVEWPSGSQACSASTASQVVDMMKTVVSEGTGTNAQVNGLEIAGKTGTGEQADENGGYKSGSFLASFVGFAPADDASVLIYVGLNDTPYLASESAAPTFSAIMSEASQDLSLSTQ
ncbi:MAG: penicillin-binding protein 2 [Atopobiaceae bacterium]|nr:penicillin-binding protein 2 [Atopobiaceae bacterium]MCH4275827.1 penicillin-binding protein 2 [Atopobiaceae bacterium]MCI1225809.1 penicillin-binding protein 2 [Atopobiaceae bacterium]